MGKGRDRRSRRDRFDDEDEVPHYGRGLSFTPQSFGTGPSLDATVKWFNVEKGFGFVELADGSGDAFIHFAKLQSAGHDSVEPGTKLVVQVGQGQKGRQVEAVVSVDVSTAMLPRRSLRTDRMVRHERDGGRHPSDATELHGTVKWYNPVKGFGFAGCDDGDKDVFIHASALERSGLRGLDEGQRILMKVERTERGHKAISIALDGPKSKGRSSS